MAKWELRTEGCAVPLARDIESGEWIGHSEVADYFIHHHNADVDALTAERDRLAAENAEFKKGRGVIIDEQAAVLKQLRSDLAAANATLDVLREAVPEGDEIYGWNERAYLKLLLEIQRRLHPQPKETIRDKAKRLGFDDMPAELGQRNLDGETSYVQLETTHDDE